MSLFNNVGGVHKTNSTFDIKKPEKTSETSKVGLINFNFGESQKVKAAMDLFGEDDAKYALFFAEISSNIDPDANIL